MRGYRLAGLAFVILVCGQPTLAHSQDCSTVACRTVVSSIDELHNNVTTKYAGVAYDKITVTCYHDISPKSVCAGGGDFDRVLFGTDLACSNSKTGLHNGATLIQDSQGDCFYRKNFGLNGIVDARQCGVYGDGVHDDAAALNGCIGIASQLPATGPPLPNSYWIVTTGGGVVLDNTADIKVTDNITLTCGGTGIVAATNNDYRIPSAGGALSKAIVLDPTGHGGAHYTVRLTGNNARYRGCTEVAGAGADGSNPFSPSIWYPGCNAGPPATCSGTQNLTVLRSSLLEASAFSPNPTAQYASGGPASQSVGVTIDGASHASVHDIAVLGFGTCFKIRARDVGLDNCSGDCWRGVDALTADIPRIRDCTNGPLLTPNTRDTGTAAP